MSTPQPQPQQSSGPSGHPFPLGNDQLADLAGAEKLLVAVDFDGTLAEFSDSPSDVRAVPGALEALRGLAELPSTWVLIISGRQLSELSAVTGLPVLERPSAGDIRLVGSHGAEVPGPATDSAAGDTPGGTIQQVLRELGERAEQIAAADPGMWVEYKPFSVGLHTRQAASPEAAEQAQQRVASLAEGAPGVSVTWGRDILELSVATATKGSYLTWLRAHLGEPVVFFAGDDVTDETALRALSQVAPLPQRQGGADVGVHVGGRLASSTAAAYSLPSPTAVSDALATLLSLRGAQR